MKMIIIVIALLSNDNIDVSIVNDPTTQKPLIFADRASETCRAEADNLRRKLDAVKRDARVMCVNIENVLKGTSP